ncbi:MAG: dihydrofolate reductase family protein [Chloroflexota bacterium]
MRKLVLKMDMSIDGFVGRPDDSVDWISGSRSEDGAAWVLDVLAQAGTHLIGGNTARGWATYWPTSALPFAAPMNEIPKVIFSKSLKQIDWQNSQIVSGDLVEEITRLKQQDGKYLLAQGGVRFAQSLAKHHLIDEYRLITRPVALGSGLPLFSTLTEPLNLELVDVIPFKKGAVAHIYRAA